MRVPGDEDKAIEGALRQQATGLAGTGQTVFVVDDEGVISSTVAIILNQSGYKATSFTNPQVALAACDNNPPDVLIADLVMPQMSGAELAIKVKELCPECKMMLMSGHISTSDLLEEARQKGYRFEVHSKPIHPYALLQRLEDLISRSSRPS